MGGALGVDSMAENLASEVIQASTDFDGQDRAPMRLAGMSTRRVSAPAAPSRSGAA